MNIFFVPPVFFFERTNSRNYTSAWFDCTKKYNHRGLCIAERRNVIGLGVCEM